MRAYVAPECTSFRNTTFFWLVRTPAPEVNIVRTWLDRAIKKARLAEPPKENGERQSVGDQEASRITQRNHVIVRKHVILAVRN